MTETFAGTEAEERRRVGNRLYPPRTPRHTVRVEQALWDRALDRAIENGETVTQVVVRALERYAR